MKTPQGKGMYIWIIRRLTDAYGSNEAVADRLVEMGVTWVTVKIADGTGKYNLRPTYIPGTNIFLRWTDDIIKPFIAALRRRGISVWGFQYIYGTDAKTEAEAGIIRYRELGLDGFVINAEKELKNRPAIAYWYTSHLVDGLPDVPIALTSYRYPSYHPSFPFKEFLTDGIFHMPQIYWLGASNPAYQLKRSIKELQAISDVPVVPIGLAYSEGGYPPPTQSQMDEFHNAVIELELPAESWWEFEAARVSKLLDFITEHSWGTTPPNPPTPPQNVIELNSGEEITVRAN